MVLIQLVLICLENLQIAAAAHFLMQDYFEALIPEPQHYCKHLSEKTSANRFKKSPLVAISSTFQKMIMRLI